MVLLVFIFSYLYIKIFVFNSHTVESLTNNFWMIMRTFLSFQLNSLINLYNLYKTVAIIVPLNIAELISVIDICRRLSQSYTKPNQTSDYHK